MSFQNLQINADELPRTDEIVFQSLAPAYVRQIGVQSLLVWTPILLASLVAAVLLAVFATPLLGLAPPLIPALLAALLVPLALRRARTAGFALREHDIAFRYGVLFRKVVVLPFHRVQHVEVASGPLQRRYGLASLKLYTAGASDVDLRIDGLTAERAASLREHVTARAGDAGDG